MSSSPATLATPVLATPDVTVCRQYSFPSSLQAVFDGWLQQLTWPETWSVGIETGAASVEEITDIFQSVVNDSVLRGCYMVGQILELAVDDIPSWALVCDGSTYANDEYPELAAVISTGLVVDSTHFRVPDRYNRIGLYGPPTGYQAGENTHTLTSGEMPAHTHTDTGHQHSEIIPVGEFLAVGPGEEPVVLAISSSLTGSASANNQNTGGGGAHNNLPQYEGTIFVIVAMTP